MPTPERRSCRAVVALVAAAATDTPPPLTAVSPRADGLQVTTPDGAVWQVQPSGRRGVSIEHDGYTLQPGPETYRLLRKCFTKALELTRERQGQAQASWKPHAIDGEAPRKAPGPKSPPRRAAGQG